MRLPRFPLLALVIVLGACWRPAGPVENPDPNHTHADFSVWVNGEHLDFSAAELMSGAPDAEHPEGEHAPQLHKYLHLHDGNGTVVHRHKPGLTLQEFFASLQVGFEESCYVSFAPMADGQICDEDGNPWRMFVNGEEQPFDLSYVFTDLDRILLTTSAEQEDIDKQLAGITDDACLYSQTCPERGKPPVENCVADPAVPCVQPE